VPNEFAHRLQRLDACAVSDALDQFSLPASVTGLRSLSIRRRVSGRVTTVKLAAGNALASSDSRHLCTLAIDKCETGSVIVVEQRTGIECAGWGGILSTAAQARGVAGVIVEGLARDINEAADLGFPIYGRGATARTARGRIHEAATDCPILVGDVSVNSGDYVVADSSGVAFLPASRIEEILVAAERIATKEGMMVKAVLGGQRVSEVMGRNYERLLGGDKS
jgi:4-hydroxy-4-methyl-2-oxoglutarate aldolase